MKGIMLVDVSPFIHEAVWNKCGYNGSNLRKDRIGLFLNDENERNSVIELGHSKLKDAIKLIPSDLYPKMILCFDPLNVKSMRYSIYSEYKGTRKEKPYSGKGFNKMVTDYYHKLKANGITVLEADGMEADDIIAHLSVLSLDNGINSIIVSPDSDLKQLVDNRDGHNCVFFDTGRGKNILFVKRGYKKPNTNTFDENDEFGGFFDDASSTTTEELFFSTMVEIDPNKLLLTKIIGGDKSDNIPQCISYIRGKSTMFVTDKRVANAISKLDDKDVITDWEFVKSNVIGRLNELLETKKKKTHIVDVDRFKDDYERNVKLIKLNTIDFKGRLTHIEDTFFDYSNVSSTNKLVNYELGYETNRWDA